MQKPAVSIIIPTYNRSDLLAQCLQSVINQTYTNWEAIVVNNDSTDNTIAVVNSFNDDRIKLINYGEKHIIGAVRNVGVHHSQADYLAFLDSDDFWEPEKLSKVMALFTRDNTIDLICHEEWLLQNDKKQHVLKHPRYASYHDLLFKNNTISTSATTIKRSAFFAVNGFSEDPNFMGVEDYDFWMRLAKAKQRFLYLPVPLGIYRIHNNGFTAQIEKHMQNTLKLLDLHFKEWEPKNDHYTKCSQKRYGAIYRSTGHSFIKCKNIKPARAYLKRALKNNPLDYKAWILMLLTFLLGSGLKLWKLKVLL